MKISLKRLQLFHNKKLRKIRRWNKNKRNRNRTYKRNKYVRVEKQPKHKNKWESTSNNKIILRLPSKFSLHENPDDVIKFINNIEKSARLNNPNIIEFKLDDVIEVDVGALALFLSKLNVLSARNIKAWGNFPKNKYCSKFIHDSGFLNTMRDMITNKRFFKSNDNSMVTRGFRTTDNESLGKLINKIVAHLTGIVGTYQPLYTFSQEICANSVEHANENNQDKNWLYSVNYESDYVTITLVDIGEGIMNTIEKKAVQAASDLIKLKGHVDILESLFNGDYQSRTGDRNRYKGLPKINRMAVNGFIENLIVITNKVLLDFSNKQKSRKLSNELNGTYYCCKISKNCIEKWRKRLN